MVDETASLVPVVSAVVLESSSSPHAVARDATRTQMSMGAAKRVRMTRDGSNGSVRAALTTRLGLRCPCAHAEVSAVTKTAGVDPVGSRASTEHGHTIGVSYQPIVELPDARIAVVEALVRGVDPGVELDEGMFDSPELLGRVVDHVIASAKNLGDLTVSVNLSGHDLSSTATLEHTGRLVDHLGVKRVQLEVSELSAPFGPTALRLLDHLRLIGVAVVLDHFGAGMTATAVRSHQFDGVKLDRALQSDRRPSALGVAEALVAFANNLGLEVTAVGVEDAAVLVALTDAGVARFQGHMFAKAMPAELIARQLS